MSKPFFIILGTFLTILTLRLLTFYSLPLPFTGGERVDFQTTIFTSPQQKGNSQPLTVRVGDFWKSQILSTKVTSSTEISYGDRVEIAGRLTKLMLKSGNAVWTIQNPQITAKNSLFLPVFARIRQEILALCEKTFSQKYASLIVGVLFGIKNNLPSQLTVSLSITGVTHVVAASGMNVTMVGSFLLGVLGRLLSRRLTLLFTILGIAFYVCLSGFDPSIVRAAFMGILAFGAQLYGRQYTGLYTLGIVSGAMLFWDPLLLGNVGFQLSVLSTMGIILIKPLIPLKGILLDDVGTTLAAQVTTLPIIFITFGQYGLVSLLVNTLVLWTIPVVMTIGGIGIAIGLIIEPLGKVILVTTIPLLWYFISVVEYFAKLNWVVKISPFPWTFLAGYYCFLAGGYMWIRRRK